jgi:hypothetical protein
MDLRRTAGVIAAAAAVITLGTATKARAATSIYAAGYIGQTASTATLTATFKVPKLKCAGHPVASNLLTVLLEGTDSGGVEVDSGADIGFNCSRHGVSLGLQTDDSTGTTNSVVPVSAGNVIDVSVSASATQDTETYDDVTTHKTAAQTGTGFTAQHFQLMFNGGFGNGEAFPGFTPIKFTSVLVDGAPLGQADPTLYDEVSPTTGQTQIATSAINSSGEDFTDTFVSG